MEKAISNVDVLCEIFQHLGIEELIKLTEVCWSFRTVIVEFVWKNKYKQVEICKTTQNFRMLLINNVNSQNNEKEIGFECTKEDRAILNRKDVKTFLQLFSNNIRMLVMSAPMIYYHHLDNEEERKIKFANLFTPPEFGVIFGKRHSFVNLTTVIFRSVLLTEMDFRLLSENSKILEKICLYECFNIKEKPLIIGEDIKISTLQNMKALKCFEISGFATLERDYDVNMLLGNLNVIKLVIAVNNFVITSEDENEMAVRASDRVPYIASRCEELNIEGFRSPRIFRKFNNSHLINFNRLKKLVMGSNNLTSINEEFFKKLAKTCSQLEYLKLENFEINGFATIATLKSLILYGCMDLTWRNVKAMLGDMKLSSFSILDTEYVGQFEYFNVATTLEHLVVTNCQRNHLKKLFEINDGQNLKNLTSLTWHDNFAGVPIYVVTSGLKLKTLITEPSLLLINNLYYLSRLEKLTLRTRCKMKFSKILIILQHSNLKYFTFTKLDGDGYYENTNDYLIVDDVLERDLMEFNDKQINLVFINISLNTYEKVVQEFWFNLLKNNPKLKIMIRYNRHHYKDHTFLKFIINNRKFPKRLKSIKICGYNIEIKEFRDNFDAVVEKIISYLNLYKEDDGNEYILL